MLAGQELNGATWAMCKMNMILHGITGADIRNGDTLEEPLHREGGELMRFDRVIANPPFSQNYSARTGSPSRALPVRVRAGDGEEGRPHVRAAHAQPCCAPAVGWPR
jgi:hypothetical protein